MHAANIEGARALFAANRAEGRIAVEFGTIAGHTYATRTREEGSLRIRFPASTGRVLEAVLVNTAGGIAGGDNFAINLDLTSGAKLTVTTASAEKVYRSLGPCSRIEVTAKLADDAEFTWLPHETILFNCARLARHVDVTLAPTAKLLFAETIVFGRTAMGEIVSEGRLFDRWRIRRDGRLIFAENFCLDGAIATSLSAAAVAKGQVALGTMVLTPGDEGEIDRVRAASAQCWSEIGISAWNGIAVARLVAPDGATLRHDLGRVLRALGSAALPRLWLN